MLQISSILKKKKIFKSNSTEDSSVIVHLNSDFSESELGENIAMVVVCSVCWNMKVEGIYINFSDNVAFFANFYLFISVVT